MHLRILSNKAPALISCTVSLGLMACGGESEPGATAGSGGSDSGTSTSTSTSTSIGVDAGGASAGGASSSTTGGSATSSSDTAGGSSTDGSTEGSGGSSSGGSTGSGGMTSSASGGNTGGGSGSGGAGGSAAGGSGGTGVVPPDLDWQCDGTACVPGAECDEDTGFCECGEGFTGDGWWCLSTSPCADSPCLNGGTCHPTIGDRMLCTCPAGFGGVHCEIPCSGEIEIPDAAFESAVRSAALLDAQEPLTAEALADVTSLSIFDTPIGDLSGIECMTSLSWVTMHDVGLIDLTPFASLPRLTSLQVDCNSFTDISPIASLINLVQFNAGKSSSCEAPGQVTDITPLADLVGLADLDLSGHDIDSLASLAPLTHLQWLILASNANLASLSGIESAMFLEYFVATDTLVSDVSMFAGHPTVQTLWLSGSQVSDLAPLLTASALEEVYVRATSLDCEAQSANIAALEANDVYVSHDCD